MTFQDEVKFIENFMTDFYWENVDTYPEVGILKYQPNWNEWCNMSGRLAENIAKNGQFRSCLIMDILQELKAEALRQEKSE